MRVLIRNEGETVTEAMGIPGIDWTTGMPLTSPHWAGGAYTLVQDYVEATEDAEPTHTVVEETGDTIVIDGVTYQKV